VEPPLLEADAFRTSWLYRMYFFWPIWFSRGCPHPCEYCAVQSYYQRTHRTRPVDDVIADIEELRTLRRPSSSSSTTTRPPGRTRRRALPAHDPLGTQWVGQVTTSVTRDDELLDLVATPAPCPLDRLRASPRRTSRPSARISTARAASRRTWPSSARAASR
jgi:DNA repair photolyase